MLRIPHTSLSGYGSLSHNAQHLLLPRRCCQTHLILAVSYHVPGGPMPSHPCPRQTAASAHWHMQTCYLPTSTQPPSNCPHATTCYLPTSTQLPGTAHMILHDASPPALHLPSTDTLSPCKRGIHVLLGCCALGIFDDLNDFLGTNPSLQQHASCLHHLLQLRASQLERSQSPTCL